MGAYFELISTIFKTADNEAGWHNHAVAFTSVLPEEGVSFVVQSLARELAAITKKRVVIVDARAFHDLQPNDAKHVLRQCARTDVDNLLVLSAEECVGRGATKSPTRLAGWHSSPHIREAYLKTLRQNFDYVIIDCPALTASSDVKALAPIMDGVALVVATNRARVRQTQRSQYVVESFGGKFLGYILNYPR